MREEVLKQLRSDLINGNNAPLKKIYLRYKDDCHRILKNKPHYTKGAFQDIYTDAIIVFRDNIVSGKIEALTSVKNYLVATCINMSRQDFSKELKKKSKQEQVKLLLYPDGNRVYQTKEDNSLLIAKCKKSLGTLTEKCQKILKLYYVHNLTMKEIAAEMSLSSSDVSKTMKSRCYKKWISKTKELMS